VVLKTMERRQESVLTYEEQERLLLEVMGFHAASAYLAESHPALNHFSSFPWCVRLFVAYCHRRVDQRGTAGGQVAGEEGDYDEQAGHGGEGEGIVRGHTEQQVCH
jgi:hypothetical protein